MVRGHESTEKVLLFQLGRRIQLLDRDPPPWLTSQLMAEQVARKPSNSREKTKLKGCQSVHFREHIALILSIVRPEATARLELSLCYHEVRLCKTSADLVQEKTIRDDRG